MHIPAVYKMDELTCLRRMITEMLKDDALLVEDSKPRIKGDKQGNVTVPAAKLQEVHELLLASQETTAVLNGLVKELIIQLTLKNELNISDIIPIHKLSSELNLSIVSGVSKFQLCVPLEFPTRCAT